MRGVNVFAVAALASIGSQDERVARGRQAFHSADARRVVHMAVGAQTDLVHRHAGLRVALLVAVRAQIGHSIETQAG